LDIFPLNSQFNGFDLLAAISAAACSCRLLLPLALLCSELSLPGAGPLPKKRVILNKKTLFKNQHQIKFVGTILYSFLIKKTTVSHFSFAVTPVAPQLGSQPNAYTRRTPPTFSLPAA
jgi:hypothetical protein